MGDLSRIQHIPVFQNAVLIHRNKEYPINPFLLSSVSRTFFDFLVRNQNTRFFELPSIRGNLSEFLSLFYGQSININSDNMFFLNYLAIFLKIDKLIEETEACIQRTSHKFSSLVRFTNQLITDGLECDHYLSQILKKNKKILKYKHLKHLSCQFLISAFSPLMKHHSDEKVVRIILDLIRYDQAKFHELLTLIDLPNLSALSCLELLNTPNVDINQFRSILQPKMNSIFNFYPSDQILFLPKMITSKTNDETELTQFSIDESNFPFDGILTYFQRNNQLLDSSSIQVRASDEQPNCDVQKLLELNKANSYYSSRSPNASIYYDFLRGSLKLTHYILRPYKNSENSIFPSSWTVYISSKTIANDGTTTDHWMAVDTHTQDYILEKGSALFKVSDDWDFCSSIKITQHESNKPVNDNFVLSAVEFYGIWKDKYYQNS